MEHERKYLISEFPKLPLLEKAVVKQGYLYVDPEIRIRSKTNSSGTDYVLCFKDEGTISRKETEIHISQKSFKKLSQLVNGEFITKDYRVYQMGTYKLECSIVDKGSETEFMYTEIEFNSAEEAERFSTPAGYVDVTSDLYWKMKYYWERTRIMHAK